MRYRDYLQTTLGLKPSTVNRTLMSLKRYFASIRKTQLIQSDPAGSIKFVPKEVSPPRHLSDEEEDALVAAVNATGTLRDQTIITLLLHTGLRARELCSLTRQQLHLGRRNGTLRIIGKRKKVRGATQYDRSINLESVFGNMSTRISVSLSFGKNPSGAHRASTGTFSHEICHTGSGR